MAGGLATAPAPQLGHLEVPTLMLWGERDAVFPAPARRDLLAWLPGARSVSYPETGHARGFAGDLVSFLPTSADR